MLKEDVDSQENISILCELSKQGLGKQFCVEHERPWV